MEKVARYWLYAVGMLLMVFSGCGTIHNFQTSDEAHGTMGRGEGPGTPSCCYRDIYGGVQEDVDVFMDVVTEFKSVGGRGIAVLLVAPPTILDLVLSSALDTVTLPYTIYEQVQNDMAPYDVVDLAELETRVIRELYERHGSFVFSTIEKSRRKNRPDGRRQKWKGLNVQIQGRTGTKKKKGKRMLKVKITLQTFTYQSSFGWGISPRKMGEELVRGLQEKYDLPPADSSS